MSLTSPQQVGNKSYNGIWETTRHNRHNGLLPAPTCYGFAMGKLWGNWCNEFWPIHSQQQQYEINFSKFMMKLSRYLAITGLWSYGSELWCWRSWWSKAPTVIEWHALWWLKHHSLTWRHACFLHNVLCHVRCMLNKQQKKTNLTLDNGLLYLKQYR